MVTVLETLALLVEEKKRLSLSLDMANKYVKLAILGCIVVSLGALALERNEIQAANTNPVNDDTELLEVADYSSYRENNAYHTVTLSSAKSAYQQLDSKKEGRANTTYVIQSDFDLEGKTINMPENCVLRFEGGVLRNGAVVGDNTNIEAPPRQLFATSMTLKGTWCIDQAFVEWFGARAMTKYNKTAALNNAAAIQLAANTFQNVSFAANSNNKAFYYVTAEKGSNWVINIHEPVSMSGINQVSTQIVYVGESDIPVFYLTKSDAEYVFGPRYASIQNMCIRGEDYKCRKGTAIYVENGVAHVKFENLYFCYLNECFVSDTWSVNLNTCKAEVSNVGFRMGVEHKGMPAQNLTRCTAGYCKIAFALKSVFYSTMLNCSSDYCEVAWAIDQCIGLTLMTIGAEHCKQFMDIKGNDTRHIKLSNAFICVYKNDEMTKEDWNNFVSVGEKVRHVVFEEVDFEMNEPKALSSLKNRDTRFIMVKGPNSQNQAFTISNSYCSRGDVNGFIDCRK